MGGKYRFVSEESQFRPAIEERISQGKPTIIRLAGRNNPSSVMNFIVSTTVDKHGTIFAMSGYLIIKMAIMVIKKQL